jgi:YVTN family beta-propeller protein
MNKKIISIIFLALAIYISGCNREEIVSSNNNNPPVTNPKKGLYILSEGSMSVTGSAKLSFYDLDSTLYENIFKPGTLGNAPDGMIYDGTNILLTEQGNYNSAGKIYRIDTGGTVISSQIVGTNPYSLCIANNKIYVTNGPANNVSVLDLSSLATLKTINTGIYPQEILSYNNKVFVCNTSNWGGPYDSTVYVIDPTTDSVVKKIQLKREPTSIALSNNNKILVGCSGSTGYVFTVDPNSFAILDSASLESIGGFGKDISIDKNSDNIYFITNMNNIGRLNLATKDKEIEIHNPNTANTYFYGYLFDSKLKKHYIADARTFTSSGVILVYSFDNVLMELFYTGYAPRRLMLLDN